MSAISFERRNSHAFVWLAPGALECLDELIAILTRLSDVRDLRAVILSGLGSADPDSQRENPDETRKRIDRRQRELLSVCQLIDGYAVPVIVCADGVLSEQECELLLACHLRVASDGSRFNFADASGEVTDRVLQQLVRESSRNQSGDAIPAPSLSAAEAQALGLLNCVTSSGQVAEMAMALVEEMVELAPLAIRNALAAVTRGSKVSLVEGLVIETDLFASLFGTADRREGISAFLEKRAPAFRGT
jgi:enoyl-CoA hydratase/carnithine racemase